MIITVNTIIIIVLAQHHYRNHYYITIMIIFLLIFVFFFQIFPDKTGVCWNVLRNLFYGLSLITHISLAVTFLSFFVTSLSFSVNCALELTLEMITPTGDSVHRRNFYAACLFVLLLCVLIMSSLVLSLFWELVILFLYKSAMKYTCIKILFFFVIVVAAGIWSAVTKSAQTGFLLFLSKSLIVSWVLAFVLSLLGSLFLLGFVYTKQYFIKEKWFVSALVFHNVVLFIFSILSPIAFHLVGASTGGIAFAFLLPFCTLILSIYLPLRGSKEENKDFVIQKKAFLLISTVFLGIVIVGASIVITCGEECQLGPPTKENNLNLRGYSQLDTPKVPGYPICNAQWGTLKLDITDMAFLADAAYKINGKDKVNISSITNDYFSARSIEWVVKSVNPKRPFFFHIRNPSKQVNVIGIRGTADARDWFENVKVYNEIAVLQLISVALPIQNLPFEFIAFFIAQSSSVSYLLQRSTYSQYFKPLEDYLQAERNSTEEYHLVGHSLGGGLAKIIGSRNKIPAVAISSPGDIYNHIKFDYSVENVQKYTTTISAQNDPTAWIDKCGGLEQNIQCDNSNFIKCHSIRNTYCELKKKCHATTKIPCPDDPKMADMVMAKIYKEPTQV